MEAARVNVKRTQDEIARRLGIHRTTLYNWETGKSSPNANQLRKIGELTKVPIDYIFLPGNLPKADKKELYYYCAINSAIST